MIYDNRLLERLYRASPVVLQNLFVTAYGVLKVLERWSPAFRRYVRELEVTQWWSPERLLELQAERLTALIQHCYETVPYYRTTFDRLRLKPTDIRTPQDLYKLPV